jgi:hypothetical protein
MALISLILDQISLKKSNKHVVASNYCQKEHWASWSLLQWTCHFSINANRINCFVITFVNDKWFCLLFWLRQINFDAGSTALGKRKSTSTYASNRHQLSQPANPLPTNTFTLCPTVIKVFHK